MYQIFLFLIFVLSVSAQEPEKPTYEKALAEYKNSQYTKSLEIIRSLILSNENKGNYEWHYLAAHAYWGLSNFKSAKDHFSASIKFKPEDSKAYIDLIKLYENMKLYKQALTLCESSIELFPADYDLKIMQASLLVRFSKFSVAIEKVEKLKEINAKDFKPLLIESNVYFMQNDFEKAELTLKWAASLASNNPIIQNNLALVYEQISISLKQKNKIEEAKLKMNLASNEINQAIKNSNSQQIIENQKRISEGLKKL